MEDKSKDDVSPKDTMHTIGKILLDKFKSNPNRYDIADIGVRTGFRTYFDPYCEEWKDTSTNQKLAFYEMLEDAGISFEYMVHSYRTFWINFGRFDIAQAALEAVERACPESFKRYHRN